MPAWGSSNSILFGATIAALSDKEADIIDLPGWCSPSMGARGRHSKPLGMLAFVSAAARAFIQPARNSLSSEGGLPLVYPAQAVARTSWRLNSWLLWASWSSLHWPDSFSALTAPG